MEEELLLELQGNRPRSRTWPLPQPEDLVVEVDKNQEEETATKQENSKKTSRKNAWGNLSYADLITQAITSSPEQRMTLSQIYSWMVDNIPYFKDKGDSTSSAGWKNSIRHNLSLHSRFMRVQNEGNGKSSWWMLNHDAKAEKTKRRSRSSSLDSDAVGPKLKTKRGRKATKRDSDEIPQSPKSRTTLTPKSPTGEPTVIIEDNPFPFSIADYRTRSSSNTSNVSSIGRLSPIHDEDEVSMTMSPAHEHGKSTPMDELMDNMKENLSMSIVQSQGDLKSSSKFDALCNNNSDTNNMVAQQVMNIVDSPPTFVDNRYPTSRNDYHVFNPQMKIHQPKSVYADATILRSNGLYQQQQPRSGSSSPNHHFTLPERSIPQQPPQQHFTRQPPSYSHAVIMNNYLQKQKEQQCNFHGNNFVQQAYNNNIPSNSYEATLPSINIEMADKLPVDVDVDFLEGDIECDVENVLRKELAFNDGYLDFNLDNYVPSIALPEPVPLQSYVPGHMVH